ncbi:ABC transporter permease [Bacteroidota bacterium]
MLKNYFKVAIRNIFRQWSYTILNVLGLSLGLTCFILITLFIQFEFSYDKFNENYDNIYRIEMDFNGKGQLIALMHPAVGPALVEEYPEIINFARFSNMGNRVILDAGEERKYNENFGWWAENSFFEIFSYSFVRGNPKTALDEPYSIVLTETTAEKFFSDSNPIGQTIRINNSYDCKVTAVLKDPPKNSHINFHFIVSYKTYEKEITPDYLSNWRVVNGYTYVHLSDNVSLESINSKVKDIFRKYISPEYPSNLYLKPLSELHLYSNVLGELGPSGDLNTIIIYLAIGVFILLIASVNFMNLSTARSMKRAREVGMRKVAGASRIDLMLQFLGESILLTFISLAFSLVFVGILLAEFNSLVGREISFGLTENPLMTIFLLVIGLFVGIISGSYPSIYLSRFNPVKVLRSSFKNKPKKFSDRNILVVFQFGVSAFLIIGTIIIYNQLNFLKNRNVGFEKENIIVMEYKNVDSLTTVRYETFREEIKTITGVTEASISQFVPHFNGASYQTIYEGAPEGESIYTNINYIDDNFLETFGINLSVGKSLLNPEMNIDSTFECYINDTFRKKVGWDFPIGKRIANLRVEGVVNDYQFNSMRRLVQPIILRPYSGWETRFANRGMCLSIKLNSQNNDDAIKKIRDLFEKRFPNDIFEYRAMEEFFGLLFRNDDNLAKTASYFSLLAIFISCLGLLGLSTFIAEQKRKEIGIRKVLGSSVFQVIFLLTRSYSILIIISNILVWPFIYYVMNKWLSDFSYRIEIKWYVFLTAAMVTLLIGWLSVAYQTLKAAITNPVESLRYE